MKMSVAHKNNTNELKIPNIENCNNENAYQMELTLRDKVLPTRNKLTSDMLVTPCFQPGSAHGPRPDFDAETSAIQNEDEPNL